MENEKREERRGIFLGVIGVLTLIVAIIGASLAYFSINATSNTDAVTVQAASVQIVYKDGNELALSDIIPSEMEDALKTLGRGWAEETDGEGQTYEPCVDDNGYTVCSVYDFSLTNNGEQDVEVKMTVVPTELGEGETAFKNLKFVLYDITDVDVDNIKDAAIDGTHNGKTVYEGAIGYSTFGLLDSSVDKVVTINGSGDEKRYRMFIWLDETGATQDDEQGAIFKGTIHIDTAGVIKGVVKP